MVAPLLSSECFGPKGAEEEFLDGGLSCNNPVLRLIEEVEKAFPELKPKFPNLQLHFDCILSIGTGKRDTMGLGNSEGFHQQT